jgi:hypothetical protein
MGFDPMAMCVSVETEKTLRCIFPPTCLERRMKRKKADKRDPIRREKRHKRERSTGPESKNGFASKAGNAGTI